MRLLFDANISPRLVREHQLVGSRVGNAGSKLLEKLLRDNAASILWFDADPFSSLLVLD